MQGDASGLEIEEGRVRVGRILRVEEVEVALDASYVVEVRRVRVEVAVEHLVKRTERGHIVACAVSDARLRERSDLCGALW